MDGVNDADDFAELLLSMAGAVMEQASACLANVKDHSLEERIGLARRAAAQIHMLANAAGSFLDQPESAL